MDFGKHAHHHHRRSSPITTQHSPIMSTRGTLDTQQYLPHWTTIQPTNATRHPSSSFTRSMKRHLPLLILQVTQLSSHPRTSLTFTHKSLHRITRNFSMASSKYLVVDPFCHRQFAEVESSKGYAGTVL